MTTPTPPIELTGSGERFTGDVGPPPQSLLDRLSAICETITDTTPVWPRPVATGGHSRCTGHSPGWSHAWPAQSYGPRPPPRWRRSSPPATRRGSRSPRPVVEAECRERRCRSTAASCSTPPRWSASARSTLRRVSSRSALERSGRIWRRSCAPSMASPSVTSRRASIWRRWVDRVACRGAGQYSTRVREDRGHGRRPRGGARRRHGHPHGRQPGQRRRTGPQPSSSPGRRGRSASSRGCGCAPIPCPVPNGVRRTRSPTFGAAVEACRMTLRRGATPAVLRLYDAQEAARGRGGDGSNCILLVLDEGDPAIVDATMAVVAESCAAVGATAAGRRARR